MGFGIAQSKVNHGWRCSPGVLESGAGAEPLLWTLDAPGMEPGAGQRSHSWGNYQLSPYRWQDAAQRSGVDDMGMLCLDWSAAFKGGD